MSFKDELKKEYKDYQERQKRIAKIIDDLSAKFANYIINDTKKYFELQHTTFETALKTSLKKDVFIKDIKTRMLEKIRKGDTTFFISSDSWDTDLFEKLLGYSPSYSKTGLITKALISEYLKNIKYREYFKDTDCPTLKDLTDKLALMNRSLLQNHYKIQNSTIINNKLRIQYLSELRTQLTFVLEDFLTKEGLEFNLETEDNSDIPSMEISWTNNYLIEMI